MLHRRTFLQMGALSSAASLSLASGAQAQGGTSGAGAGTSSGTAFSPAEKSGLAVALGGGAAKAFAHIPVLEAFDELGIKPDELAGTSMGAILGSLYAGGMAAVEIRAYVIELFAKRRPLLRRLFLDSGRPISSLFNLTRPAIIDPLVLFEAVLPCSFPKSFSDLQIPLKIVATNFHGQSQVVLNEGPLLPAVAASSALPVLLTPVRINGSVLIDGGFVNPTPFDVLDPGFKTIGVDVTGTDFVDDGKLPSALETWIGSFSITLHSLVTEKLKRKSPDLLIEPPVGTFSTMDFFKIENILTSVDASKDRFKRQIAELMEDH
ncbi:NTE family protein [Roseibium hamelinense]|uniref:NTE family protein n=1 Tax=Roseibium hamelinense TaxID=150831 RepID=A0A562TJ58_9HYPH|nr:patatin-like phospholipase family protein [Roseibium hamelinense]MTI45822.1 patatin-like phospholipase family protein [Roseibium hamelinense]TWI92996.1 NTE family protein [Roseibium hamelinense]